MKNAKKIEDIFLILLTIFILSCASAELPVVSIPQPTPEELEKARAIWQKVEERNKTVERTTEWINDSYNSFKVRPLATLPTYKYSEYSKYLDNGAVYIMNHPGFYTFFQHPKIDQENNLMPDNIMELFLNETNRNSKSKYSPKITKVMREFERIEKNFIEYKSTEQKLIIMILPGNYKKYSIYSYKNATDEYMRYINSVSNMSESVLYLESKKANRGQLTEDDANTLAEFLLKIGATSVLLGGEYVGRCQEDFYKQLTDALGKTIPVEIVPELSPASPDDMNPRVEDMIDSNNNNRLNIQAATNNIIENKYDKLDIKPKIRNLRSWLFYDQPPDNK